MAVHATHPPFNTSLCAIPRAVCERYKTDRRCSSHGLGLLPQWRWGPRPGRQALLLPSTHRWNIVYPSLRCVCSGRWQLALEVVGCPFASAPLLPPGFAGESAPSSQHAPGRWHAGDRRNQTRRRKSILHAMPPSRLSPHAAAGFTGVQFKESQRRQLFGLLGTGVSVSPPSSQLLPFALAGLVLALLRLPPAVGPCYAQRAPPSCRQRQERLPSLSGLGLGRRPGRATPVRVPWGRQTCRGGPVCS